MPCDEGCLNHRHADWEKSLTFLTEKRGFNSQFCLIGVTLGSEELSESAWVCILTDTANLFQTTSKIRELLPDAVELDSKKKIYQVGDLHLKLLPIKDAIRKIEFHLGTGAS